jgi:hypothetical protein
MGQINKKLERERLNMVKDKSLFKKRRIKLMIEKTKY